MPLGQSGMPSVPGYPHMPGHHCGSTALRNLLAFHGVEISEEMAFGLGAGACFYYVTIEDASPTRWFNGRTARLEENFDELTGAALELRTFERGRRRCLGGRAVGGRRRQPGPAAHRPLLPRPLRQLGPLPRPRRRPRRLRRGGRLPLRHRLRGAAEDAPRRTSTGRRHSSHPAYPLAGHMFTASGAVDRRAAARRRSRQRSSARRGRWSSPSSATSPASTRSSASPRRPARWPEVAEDWQWCARFGYQVIERRGTGGGAFRLMYSRFLEEAGRPEAPLAAEAAARWTELANGFHAASERDHPDPKLWRDIEVAARRMADAEQRLWESLADLY